MSMRLDHTWFMPVRDTASAPINIICFPCGGGTTASFYAWKKLSVDANIWVLKLPGRESRLDEPALTFAADFAQHILTLLPTIFSTPVIFYGHSMGAGLAFEAIRVMFESRRDLPSLFIAAGREPPHMPYPNPVADLSDEALLRYMQQLGGIPRQNSMNHAFLKQYIPKIRADYQLNSSIPIIKAAAMPIKIITINGKNDQLIDQCRVGEWQQHSIYPVQAIQMPGGHFFMSDDFDQFITILADAVSDVTYVC